MDLPEQIKTWQMIRPWKKDRETGEITEGRLEIVEIPVPLLSEGEVLVKVAGCGVCHTDLGYFYHGIPTITRPPLALGHEISGVIVAGDDRFIGKEIIVPAVMPCNECPICDEGRGNRCLGQKMPGNSMGIYGGFSSHIPVPVEDLCFVEDRRGFELEELAVIADAVTTPFQACVRGDLKPGDNVIIIGTGGGVGVYVTQMAKAFGANAVIGIDLDRKKLERALNYGADFVINSTDKDAYAVKNEFKSICKNNKLPSSYGWKIFEVTGTKAGQEMALALLSFIGKLVVVGFGMQKNQYSISRLMAFDADIIGTWGCLPKYYDNVLKWVLDGTIKIKPFVETRPMSQIKDAFKDAKSGKLTKRIVLTPDFV
ncbi:MAG: 6-hydroxycyclohex-1-ene-1-carbonyl-CoA dehydrogenase [Candidatus Thermoplasmatota archaeon]|jgi:6-hydroxycyclohex-1-ene-1-carbonyl-CoA dehydrogenase|nr:6-hydroxycyclohex-1-ene-1-carbonyl-CoA dehydrogenase [Candidatus Thermoplasmatota archaeon]MDP7266059.1 6-hydroxycyclohex-1-ene-1-carbonyl-CoA dehydrogenase [Candidatus Thermoplasmatota archaeon]